MSLQRGVYKDKASDFYLKEYEFLRREVEIILQDSRSLEKYIAVAIGGIWVWLYQIHAASWAWCVPCILALLGTMRAFGIAKSFDAFHEYIFKLETAFSSDDGPEGWEHVGRNLDGVQASQKVMRCFGCSWLPQQ